MLWIMDKALKLNSICSQVIVLNHVVKYLLYTTLTFPEIADHYQREQNPSSIHQYW